MSPPLLELEDVEIVRDGRAILDRLSLRIEVGEPVAILGPNGCGKSTLVRALTREIHPYAGRGRVRVLGQERWTIRELRSMIGVVASDPREPLLGDPTVLQLVVSGLLGTMGVTFGYDVTPEMERLAGQALERAEAEHLSHRRLDGLSAGELRRTFVARALVGEPRALVLDEPTTSLDLRARHDLLQTLRRLARAGTSLVLVTHHLEEIVPEIERVILMSRGRVVLDGPRAEVLTSENLSELFGLPVEVAS